MILANTRKQFKGAGEIWALFSGSKRALTLGIVFREQESTDPHPQRRLHLSSHIV